MTTISFEFEPSAFGALRLAPGAWRRTSLRAGAWGSVQTFQHHETPSLPSNFLTARLTVM